MIYQRISDGREIGVSSGGQLQVKMFLSMMYVWNISTILQQKKNEV